MRSARTADRQMIERTLTAMVALLEAGHEDVPIRKVVTLLGRDLQVAGPAEGQGRLIPDPQVDPLTGCLPVTAPDALR